MQPTTKGCDVELVYHKNHKEASFQHLRFERFVTEGSDKTSDCCAS